MWREPSFNLMGKVLQVNWLYVFLLCCLAGVGYVALYSAAGGAPEPYATRHAVRFGIGLVIMLAIGLVDIRFIAKLAWPLWLAASCCSSSSCASAMSARAPSAGWNSADCNSSRPN